MARLPPGNPGHYKDLASAWRENKGSLYFSCALGLAFSKLDDIDYAQPFLMGK